MYKTICQQPLHQYRCPRRSAVGSPGSLSRGSLSPRRPEGPRALPAGASERRAQRPPAAQKYNRQGLRRWKVNIKIPESRHLSAQKSSRTPYSHDHSSVLVPQTLSFDDLVVCGENTSTKLSLIFDNTNLD